MSKQTVTIEVDVPEGYEATSEYRTPQNGEPFLSTEPDCTKVVYGLGTGHCHRVILRKKWTPPAWMPEGAWLFKNRLLNSPWWLSIIEPHESNGMFVLGQDEFCVDVNKLSELFKYPTFEIPPVNKIQIKHNK